MKKYWKYIIACVLLLLVGFLLGRLTVKTKERVNTEIKYIKEPSIIEDSIKPFAPVEEPESYPIYLTKVDTVWRDNVQYIVEKVDTAAILSDWTLKRKYSELLFDIDTVGSLRFNADVQYNRLQNIGYVFNPIRKEVHTTLQTYKKPVIEPFIMGGVNSYWKPSFEAGLFIRAGVGASYGIEWSDQNKPIHSLKIGYKF